MFRRKNEHWIEETLGMEGFDEYCAGIEAGLSHSNDMQQIKALLWVIIRLLFYIASHK